MSPGTISPDPPRLEDLPPEALRSILKHVGSDYRPVLDVANSNCKLQSILQQWNCSKCQHAVFLVKDSKEKDGQTQETKDEQDAKTESFMDDNKVVLTMAEPFACGICKALLCGNPHCFCSSCKAERSKNLFWTCMSISCARCGKPECHPCAGATMEHCAACGWRSHYCRQCQGSCDCVCKICDSSICQNLGDQCRLCGLV